MANIIRPIWPAPAHIIAGVTTRTNGVSEPPFDTFNLATHVGDQIDTVERNRKHLASQIANKYRSHASTVPPVTPQWQWLNQTHSTDVIRIESVMSQELAADAAVTSYSGIVCAVLTADCLPILLCDASGSHVAAIHAGWRGLAGGIVNNTVKALVESIHTDTKEVSPTIYAWLGPAIGPDHFEVGEDVRAVFLSPKNTIRFAQDKQHNYAELCDQAFQPKDNNKYLADIYQLATIALNASGINHIYGGGFCTVCEDSRFFSYRRNNITGRMASFITIAIR